jgi:hypothetical protein
MSRRAGTRGRTGLGVTSALLAHTVVNARLLRRPPATPPPPRAVSILVPARDEADRIASCVGSALSSGWPDLEVVVLDDRSTDATADVARRAADGDQRLRVLAGVPPPDGWLGKPWACAQLAADARGEVLVFVDADVALAPHAVAATVALLDGGLDLACPYPRQVAEGAFARLVQPLLQWSWLTFLPLPVAERSPRASLTAANGQVMACTAATYAAVGGHGAVRGDVLEDLALARACKAAGLRAGVADGTDLATCHMYRTARDVVAGYTKSLWSAFGSPAGAVGAGALLWWLYVQPVVDAATGLWRGDRRTVASATARYGLGVAGRMVAARRTGGRTGDAVAHPASVVALLWLLARSVISRRRGTLQWRGRPVTTDAVASSWRHEAARGSPGAPRPAVARQPRDHAAPPADVAGAARRASRSLVPRDTRRTDSAGQGTTSPGGRAT